jgi:hypothetical protein
VAEMKSLLSAAGRAAGLAAMTVALLGGAAGRVAAQDPNTGALTFTGGVDAPTVYVFRGLLQEKDPQLTLWPYGDLGISLASGDGMVKSVAINIGVWNSLHTGSAGTDGPSEHLHYEEDFYTTLNLGLGGGVAVGIGYMALTSPNYMFDTIKELQVKVTKTHWLNPYGFLAMELTDQSSDAGVSKGTYLELGAAPAIWSNDRATLAIPAKLGMSLSNYYELSGEDQKFGFFDIGALVTLPLSGAASKFGAWNVHGGVDALFLGETGKAYNDGENAKIVGLIGIGVGY